MGTTKPQPARTDAALPLTKKWWRRAPVIFVAICAGVTTVASTPKALQALLGSDRAPSASDEGLAAYQRDAGAICDMLNDDSRDLARRNKTLATRLRNGRSALKLRNVLLEDQRRIVALGVDVVARLQSIDVPKGLRSRHRATLAALKRNVRRQSDYAQQLDAVRDGPGLLASIESLRRSRQPIERDAASVRAGLLVLGNGRCHLDRPRFRETVTLPSRAALPTPGVADANSAGPPASSPFGLRILGVPSGLVTPDVAPPAAGDTTAPTGRLDAKPQTLEETIDVSVGCSSEACTVALNASVRVRRMSSTSAMQLNTTLAKLARGQTRTIGIRLGRRVRNTIERALRRHRRVVIRLELKLSDAQGNSRRLRRDVAIER